MKVEEINKMSDDFIDVVEEKNNNYIIVILLYVIVIILIILFILGIKIQKKIIIENNKEIEKLSVQLSKD